MVQQVLFTVKSAIEGIRKQLRSCSQAAGNNLTIELTVFGYPEATSAGIGGYRSRYRIILDVIFEFFNYWYSSRCN